MEASAFDNPPRLELQESDSKFSPSLAGDWKDQLLRTVIKGQLLSLPLLLILSTAALPQTPSWGRSFYYRFCNKIIFFNI